MDIFPSYQEKALRIQFFGDKIERISEINPISGEIISQLEKTALYPAKHFIVSEDRIESAIRN